MKDLVYIESTPTNCSIDGRHGQVTGIWRDARGIDAVFVKLDAGPMLHCAVSRIPVGDRDQWREVISSREVDRDAFDRIIGADEFRNSCGWRGTEPLAPAEPKNCPSMCLGGYGPGCCGWVG